MTGGADAAGEAPLRWRGFSIPAGVCYGMLAAAFPGAVSSAEWSVQPAASVYVGRDDNPLLSAGPHESTTVTTMTPTMHVFGRTERSDLDVGMVLNYNNYSSDQVPDTSQQYLLLKSSTRVSERTKLGLDGDFRHDNLRRTVFTGTGLAGDTDVGLTQKDVDRKWLDLRPSWSRALTERSSLGLSYDYRDVSFANAAGTGLVNYKNQTLGLTYSSNINQRDSIFVTANASHYQASSVDNTTDTARLLVGVARAFTETSRGSFSVGASGTKQDIAGSVDHANGFVLQANAAQRSEITRLDGTISHDVSPSGSGFSIESDQLRMRLVRGLTPKVSFVLRALLLRNKTLRAFDPTVDRHYYELEPALEYQWTPRWFVGASYGYTYQKFDVLPDSATSNAVFINVTYDWERQFFNQ
jgi:hypothetical protein